MRPTELALNEKHAQRRVVENLEDREDELRRIGDEDVGDQACWVLGKSIKR